MRKVVPAALVFTCLGYAAQADWRVQKWAVVFNDVWVAGCDAYHGGTVTRPGLSLRVNNDTVQTRMRRGDAEILKPILLLADVSADQGPSRPLDRQRAFGQWCGEEAIGVCVDPHEYRVVLRVDDSRSGAEHWVQQSTYTDGLQATAWVDVPDWPAELFEYDTTKSFRVQFAGLRTDIVFSWQDEDGRIRSLIAADTKAPRHAMVARFTYDYGLDTMEALEKCVDDHIKAGRLMDPVPESIRPSLSKPPFAR